MSKTTAPLLSFDARGQLGETLVYSTWKGRPYARRYVIPANPQTAAQTSTRDTFRGLNRLWAYMPASATAAWELYALNARITSRNAWIKFNLGILREVTDLNDIRISPSAGSGLALTGMTATATAGGATITTTEPDLPDGWTLDAVHAAAIRNDDPHAIESPEIVAGSAGAAPYDVDLTGLSAGVEYVVGAWAEYTKPSGAKAYGASVQAVVTPA